MDDRARAACVCSAWRDATHNPLLLRTVHFDAGCAAKLSDAALARLCAHAGASLHELCLESCTRITPSGLLTALRDGRCSGVKRVVLNTAAVKTSPGWGSSGPVLNAAQARQLAVACPALSHAACCVRCPTLENVVEACTVLPGPLTLFIDDRDADVGLPKALPLSAKVEGSGAVRAKGHRLRCAGQHISLKQHAYVSDGGLQSHRRRRRGCTG